MVKNMLSNSSNTWSFQEVLVDLRTTRIGTCLLLPAEILHRRNLTTRVQAEININAIHALLQERQLKMTLAHDLSMRAKKARPLMMGERCYVLGPNNKWIDTLILPVHSLCLRPPLVRLLCLCPVPSSGSSSAESTSTSGTDSSTTETSSKSTSQLSSNSPSPETTTSASSSWTMSPELLEMECSFNTLLVGMREKRGHAVMRSQMGNLREQQQHITVLKQVAIQLQNQPRPVSVPPAANMPLEWSQNTILLASTQAVYKALHSTV